MPVEKSHVLLSALRLFFFSGPRRQSARPLGAKSGRRRPRNNQQRSFRTLPAMDEAFVAVIIYRQQKVLNYRALRIRAKTPNEAVPVDRSGGEYGRSPMRMRCRSHCSPVLGLAGRWGPEPNPVHLLNTLVCSSSSIPQIFTSTARCGACRVSTMPPSIRSARRLGARSKTLSILRFTNP